MNERKKKVSWTIALLIAFANGGEFLLVHF